MITEIELHRQYKSDTSERAPFYGDLGTDIRMYIGWLEEQVMHLQNTEIEDSEAIKHANELFCTEIHNNNRYE